MTDELAVGPPTAHGGAEAVGFDEFVALRGDSLLRTAYLLTHDHALAEDLLQTALVKAWGSWRRIDTSHEAYVRRILVTTYATWWRRKWRNEVPAETLPEHPGPGGTAAGATASSAASQSDDRIDLWTALGRLPRKQRAVVVLRYYEGLTEPEAAAVLGCSVGNVKSQASRALAKLRIDPALGDRKAASSIATATGHAGPNGSVTAIGRVTPIGNPTATEGGRR